MRPYHHPHPSFAHRARNNMQWQTEEKEFGLKSKEIGVESGIGQKSDQSVNTPILLAPLDWFISFIRRIFSGYHSGYRLIFVYMQMFQPLSICCATVWRVIGIPCPQGFFIVVPNATMESLKFLLDPLLAISFPLSCPSSSRLMIPSTALCALFLWLDGPHFCDSPLPFLSRDRYSSVPHFSKRGRDKIIVIVKRKYYLNYQFQIAYLFCHVVKFQISIFVTFLLIHHPLSINCYLS